jgi:5-methyltetrahydrofolate--homocysteine methyltransferase
MAQYLGLTMAIANPASAEIMNTKKAAEVLTSKERAAQSFIEHFSASAAVDSSQATAKALTSDEKITSAIVNGNREDIADLIKAALSSGTPALELVNKIMIPAIVSVGDLYEKKIYFLPQLMAAAETMKAGIDYLDPYLKKASAADKGKILLATVEGDIHDIGKNIVALLLKNYGYCVIDLGKDVSSRAIIEVAKKENPGVIGLSALMTTTMINMKEVITLARAKGVKTDFLIGGAVVTEAYAQSIGAYYAKDGVEAVKVIDKLIKR